MAYLSVCEMKIIQLSRACLFLALEVSVMTISINSIIITENVPALLLS